MIEYDISKEIIEKAIAYQNFRNKIIGILSKKGRYFDKFTVTNRDTFDGYIAEQIVYKYFQEHITDVKFWKKEIDVEIFKKIKNNLDLSIDEINIIEDYFYDRYDIEICSTTRADIKTAATHFSINIEKWTYGIPVIQMDKFGKDVVILTYVIYEDNPKKNPNAQPIKCIIIGYMDVCEIRKLPKMEKNSNANHDYHIENYESKLTDYESLEKLINKSCKNSKKKVING